LSILVLRRHRAAEKHQFLFCATRVLQQRGRGIGAGAASHQAQTDEAGSKAEAGAPRKGMGQRRRA
jgi:hypothetical protein